MKCKFGKGLLALCLLATAMVTESFALSVTSTNDANTLASNILGSGITISNATYSGAAGASGTFTGGGNIGIGSGIILTSGGATVAQGPNNSGNATVDNGSSGLASLNALVPGYTTYDATQLSFDFTSNGGDLFFNYVFGSEEYNEWVGSSFNDVFAFFLDGVNIALIPGTSIPVAINNVNNGANSSFYRDNTGALGIDTQYDGLTTVLTATALDLGAGTHHIDIAIADAGDRILDSGVMIQAGSFSDKPTDPNTVPEPSTMLLLGAGMCGIIFVRKRIKN
jgi:hypothetical protein